MLVIFSVITPPFASGAIGGDEQTGPDGLPLLGPVGTDPRTGSQDFVVPITYWMDHDDPNFFAINYSSGRRDIPKNLNDPHEFNNFARLSERNSRWRHSYSQWIDQIQASETGNTYALLHTDSVDLAFRSTFVNGKTFENGASYAKDPTYAIHLSSTGSVTYNYSCGNEHKSLSFIVPTSYVAEMADKTRYIFDKLVWLEGDCRVAPHYLLTRIESDDGSALKINWSLGSRPRVISVRDKSLHGLDFIYTNDLLTSVKDAAGRVHTFAYSSVPDENQVNRKKLTGIKIMAAKPPHPVFRKWTFGYRDEARPSFHYGGTYTGDLVIRKSDPLGKTTEYEYEPVKIEDRTKSRSAWQGRIAKITSRVKENGVWVYRVTTRQVISDREVRLYYSDGHITVFIFDGKGHLIDVRDEVLSEQSNAPN
jgi:hypothetical protein